MGAKQCSFFTGRGETTSVALLSTARAQKNERFADPWWRKYDIPTDGFVDSTGTLSRLPLRLESTEVIVYGLVDAKKMWVDFEALDEPYVPVLVGGKAVVAVWFKNFIDTDCGGAYLETCYSTFVTRKGVKQIRLPYETPMSALIQDPRSLSYLQRVVCSEAPVSTGAGAVAVEGGRCIWGFPTHPELGKITFDYAKAEDIDLRSGRKKVLKATFEASHLGKKAVSLRCNIPLHGEDGVVTRKLEIETGNDSWIGGPRLGGTHKGHIGGQQTRYGVAFKCTQHVAPWKATTDSLEFGDDDHYATLIKDWNFEPVLKVHSPDFKIIAHKPSNWISDSEAMEEFAKRQ
mmetsp:Transcript_104141/g.164337  ORF Transcript_104141/g.164337 Transcript_104141/m.164337 type:complete len:346 (+) Transcript_104141:27-1064(+)